MEITADTDPEDAKAVLTPGRASEARRKELERIANLSLPRSLTVSVTLNRSAAACRPADRQHRFEILIPTKEYDQPVTDLKRPVWHRFMQVALLYHELGHVLYSDFERLDVLMDEVEDGWQYLFKMVYNAVEDAAIESQMAAEYRLREDFTLKNITLSTISDQQHREFVELFELTDEGQYVQTYTVFEAVRQYLLDTGFGASNQYAELCDPDCERRRLKEGHEGALAEIQPRLQTYIETMLSEPDPTARVDAAHECFQAIKPVFESLPPLHRRKLQTSNARPTDAVGVSTWPARRADSLSGQPAGSTSAGDDEGSNDTTTDPGAIDPTQIRRRHSGSRGGGSGGALRSDVERLVSIVSDETAAVDSLVIPDPAEDGGDTDRWNQARQGAQKLIAHLESQLRRERRPQTRHGTRHGEIDPRRVVAAVQGSDRVFSQTISGREKDYSCQVVLDRSGSMGARIETAEQAVAQLVIALQTVGVDVSVTSLCDDAVNLELPFGGEADVFVDRLMTRRATGGTPLSDVMAVARRRAPTGRGAIPFIIVITDGNARDQAAYKDQVDRCRCPVYGVYMGNDDTDDETYFDRVVFTQQESLGMTLYELARDLFKNL